MSKQNMIKKLKIIESNLPRGYTPPYYRGLSYRINQPLTDNLNGVISNEIYIYYKAVLLIYFDEVL